jgi:hypothetical protein
VVTITGIEKIGSGDHDILAHMKALEEATETDIEE